MIQRDDILSMEYLKKTEFTGCHQGMRYRLEQTQAPEDPEGGKKLMVTVWPEPFNYFKKPASSFVIILLDKHNGHFISSLV